MKDEILEILPNDKHKIEETKAKRIYIADYKEETKGKRGVELSDTEHSIGSVRLDNDSELPIYFDGFKDNALPMANGGNSTQCEGVAFPKTCNENDWVLFIECKYPYSIVQAQNPKYDYPQKMIRQIKITVSYFRDTGILASNRRVNAIISFPKLGDPFDSWAITIDQVNKILIDNKIKIRATNTATIISSKRINI